MIKVLIVDDDKDILEVVALLLTIHGYVVETITRAEETKEKIKNFKPNIIILDVNIAGHDGRDVCRQLKKMSAAKNIPVILFSAIPDLEQVHITCGANDYLAKPFDVHELVKKIERHVKVDDKTSGDLKI